MDSSCHMLSAGHWVSATCVGAQRRHGLVLGAAFELDLKSG